MTTKDKAIIKKWAKDKTISLDDLLHLKDMAQRNREFKKSMMLAIAIDHRRGFY